MIVSYKYNFIFIKPQKTGGSTVETALSASCGPDDIITPLGRKDEIARSAGGPPVCRNFGFSREQEAMWRDAIETRDFSLLGKELKRRKVGFYAHMRAVEIKALVDRKFWRGARKITVVRHPNETAVSKAFWMYKDRFGDVERYIDSFIRKGDYKTFPFYKVKGKTVIDKFLHLETLQADLTKVGRKMGIEIPDTLPHRKTVTRTDKRPATEILTEEQKEIIYHFCKAEFEELGYKR